MTSTLPPDKTASAACDITHPDANAISYTKWWRSPTVLAIIAVGVLSGIYPDLPPRWERWDQAVLGILAALGIGGARAIALNGAQQASNRAPGDDGLKVRDTLAARGKDAKS